jgi:hypothetical protein
MLDGNIILSFPFNILSQHVYPQISKHNPKILPVTLTPQQSINLVAVEVFIFIMFYLYYDCGLQKINRSQMISLRFIGQAINKNIILL